MRSWAAGIAILSLAFAVLGFAFGLFGYLTAQHSVSVASIMRNGVLPDTPYAQYLDAPMAPLELSLPTDLTPRIGVVYRIWARTAFPHTVRTPLGVATFGGARGDGFVFEVLARDLIVVHAVNNVIFV
jgi:hypothetical protein